ncbi:MAG TPA: EAL domain-containing protein [Cellulomonas sp.]
MRLIVAISVPAGLVLSLAAAAFDAHQTRDRVVSATRWQLAVTAESVGSRLDVQEELAQLSAAMLTPTSGVTEAEALTRWDTHMRLLGVRDGAGAGDAVSWVTAPTDPDTRAAPVTVGPASDPSSATVAQVVRRSDPSLVDLLAAGEDGGAAAQVLARAMTEARDSGGLVLSAPYVPGDDARTLSGDAWASGGSGSSGSSGAGAGSTADAATAVEAAVVVPVYDGIVAPTSVAGRRERVLGWTVTTVRVAHLLDQVDSPPAVTTLVQDTGTPLGVLARRPTAPAEVMLTSGIVESVELDVGTRTWTLTTVRGDPPGALSWFPLVAGLLLTGLVVGMLATRAAAEVRANQVASDRTRDLAARTRELESITRSTPDALARVDRDGRLTFANEALRRAARLPEDAIGQRTRDLAERSPVMHAVRALSNHLLAIGSAPGLDPGSDPRRLIRMSAQSGGHWYDVRAVAELDDDGITESVLVVARDVTRFREAQDRLTHAATHDPLSGLANRDVARERGVAALATSRIGTALLLLDLDRFKLVNDSYGHAVGDELLQLAAGRVAAGRVAAGLTDRASAARLGGDEFVVLLPDVSPITADQVASRLVAAFDETFTLNGEEFAVGCSIGVVHAEPGSMPWDELLRCADVAMYRAKAAGRGCHQWYEEREADHARQRLTMAADLRRAVDEGEMYLAYQPEVDLVTGLVTGVEALMRWASPARGPVSPAEFIPVAEETGLINDLGTWALRRAVADITAHNRLTGSDLRVWVNVSPRQFAGHADRPDLVATVVDELARMDAPSRWLGIEVTESALADDARAVPMLRALHELGVGVAVDDFGTGYSSLSRLHDYPVTLLKIDQSFVQQLGGTGVTGPRAAGVIEAIVALGRSLGADVIAEGVEDEFRFIQLRALGCGLAQGYLFGRPMAFADAVRAASVIPLPRAGTTA